MYCKTLNAAIDLAVNSDSVFWTKDYYNELLSINENLYNSHLYNEGPKSALKVEELPAVIPIDAPSVNGFEILNKYFDELFASNPKVVAFGEDLGHIGDVNQGFSGLQEKHGEQRIFDTGIRELSSWVRVLVWQCVAYDQLQKFNTSIIYLYGLQPLSDDVATLHYRTAGQQSCPLIVRTRGHRLEGIWHSGSPMGMINKCSSWDVCMCAREI